jgi:hypothetical protein
MPQELSGFYPLPSSVSNASSTDSTTSPVVLSAPPAWSDLFIANKEVRAFGLAGKQPSLLYAFPTQNVLVITSSQASAAEIFNRLAARQFVR